MCACLQLHAQLTSPTSALLGWHEGAVCFAPTYKYVAGSDRYAGDSYSDEKRRTPAW